MTESRVLIEDWLPIAQIGIECHRESAAWTALPPTDYLHVWWARRPLTAARAAVLGSTLPTWSKTWPERLLQFFPDEQQYHDWFLRQLGVRGDVVAARQRLDQANALGIKLKQAYDGPRAFTVSPDRKNLDL